MKKKPLRKQRSKPQVPVVFPLVSIDIWTNLINLSKRLVRVMDHLPVASIYCRDEAYEEPRVSAASPWLRNATSSGIGSPHRVKAAVDCARNMRI
jgi:hypothetical protein